MKAPKFGSKKDKALRIVKRYAEGGQTDEGESWSPDDVPLPPSRPTQAYDSAPPEATLLGSSQPYPAAVPGQTLSAYHPTRRENVANALLGETPSNMRRRMVGEFMGSRGAGSDLGIVDAVPVIGQMFQAQEELQHGKPTQAAIAIMPGAKIAQKAAKVGEDLIVKLAGQIIDNNHGIPAHIAEDLWNLAKSDPVKAEYVLRQMPREMIPEIDQHLGQMSVIHGGSPWEQLAPSRAEKPTGPPLPGAEAVAPAAKAPVVQEPVGIHEPLDISKFQKVGSQQGTMPGGFYRAPNGEEWYIKTAPNQMQANNEKLTAELYRLAGTPVADVRLTTMGGKPAIASRVINGMQLSHSMTPYHKIQGLHDNFAVDAWLANHDAVGTGPENPLGNIIIGNDGKAYRIDTGGGLLFKGTGGLKSSFGDSVDELSSMISEINPLSQKVFSGVNPEALAAGAERVANVPPEKIRELVQLYGPKDPKSNAKLADRIIARQDDIKNTLGVVKKDMEIPSSKVMSDEESKLWEELMGNAGPETHDQIIHGVSAHPPELQDYIEKWTLPTNPGLPHGWGPQLEAAGASTATQPPYVVLKPMQINKGHSPQQVLGSLQSIPKKDLGLFATKKQVEKIESLINGYDPTAITHYLVNADAKQKANILSYLSPENRVKAEQGLLDAEQATYEALQSMHSNKSFGDGTTGHNSKNYVGKNIPITQPDKLLTEIKDFSTWMPSPHGDQYAPLAAKTSIPADELRRRGFNPYVTLFKGGEHQYKNTYPKTLEKLPAALPGQESEAQAFFMSHYPKYSSGYGALGGPYLARPQKAMEVDVRDIAGFASNAWSPMKTKPLIKAAKKRGADMLIIHGLADVGGDLQTQYLVLDKKILRGTKAKFDPAKFHEPEPNPLWGIAGAAGLGAAAVGSKEDKDKNMKRGGRAKKAARVVKEYASGGNISPSWIERNASRELGRQGGMIRSSVPGRTDKLPLNVPAGSYVLPADIPSALGQGNSLAGGQILDKMFKRGPYGMSAPKGKGGRPFLGRLPKVPRTKGFADGGEAELSQEEVPTEEPMTPEMGLAGPEQQPQPAPQDGGDQNVPIIAAGAEYLVPPEIVRELGNGDLEAGHRILDSFVLHTRREHIKTLKGLKPPKAD